MKNTYYFPHDYHARHDPKLERLFSTMGYEGIGIYWCLIEALYEQGGALKFSDLPIYSKGDKLLCERIANVVRGFELFKMDDMSFWSESCIDRLANITEKSKKASNSAQKRWGNANAMPTQCEGNAIKEKKGEEIRREEKKEAPLVLKEDTKTDEEKVNEFHYYDKFEEFWKAYPKRVGYSLATMTFRATVKNEEDFKQLMAALKNYLASKEVKDGYIKNGSNWIEDWRGWIKTEKPKRIAKPEAPMKPMSDEERSKFSETLKGLTHKLSA